MNEQELLRLVEQLKTDNQRLKDGNKIFRDDLDTTDKLLSNAESELKAYKKALKQLGKKETS